MPFGDGTGPLGLGPMTGRRAGYCAGYPVPGFMNPVPGFGAGFGRGFFGRGRGFRFWARVTGLPGWYRATRGLPAFGFPFWFGQGGFAAPYPITQQIPVINPYTNITKEEEMKILEEQKKAIKEEMKAIQEDLREIEKRINELKKGK